MINHTPIHLLPDVNTIEKHGKRFYVVGEHKYPSITTVLSDVEKPHLVDWRNSLGPVKADRETKRAADRGTAVHDMIEKFLNNDPNPTANHKLEHINEYNSLHLFLKKVDNIIMQEYALWSHTLRVAGRVDCIGEYKGKLCIIDFKTSNNTKTDSMIEDYKLQVTAYALMFQELYGIQIDNYAIIMSVERGVVPLIFTGEIAPHIDSLVKRINTFHKKHGT